MRRRHSALHLVRRGDGFRKSGDFPHAEEAYRKAVRIDPRFNDAWTELGCLMMDCRRFRESTACFRRIAGGRDGEAEADDPAQTAVDLLLGVVSRRPDWVRGQFSLGCAYEHLGDNGRARDHLGHALRLDPSRQAAVQALLARMYWFEKNWKQGIAAADRALEANPKFFLAHIVRSKCCSELGDIQESIPSMLRALAILPNRELHSGLLFEMNYLRETTPESLYIEACRWNAWYAAPLASQIRPHCNTPDPERRLKVGYVSPDLYGHPISKFLIPVLEFHHRSRFEVFVYSVGSKADSITDVIRNSTENFVSTEVPDVKLAERIRADGIDILVDLAGHTTGPAHLLFAVKPAPVQVSWLGVLSTTGMPTMDYFLGDAQMPCPGTEHLFTETIYRLPRSLGCYRPTDNVPVAPAPSLKNGYITFGCCNNPSKISREVVRLWSAIMHLVPESRMLLKWNDMETESKQRRLRQWFVEDGIGLERLIFAGASKTTQYLREYGAIDISLDPFPYNGGSTTLDTLWMGVPVVTLAGRMPVQQIGASILTAAGLSDFIAQTPEQYLKIALYLAAVVPKTPNLRQEIRRALVASPWMDEIGIVRDVENAYREMWRTWCRSQGTLSDLASHTSPSAQRF
ncbi:MAG TPA: tetratricopeptide repeat protein [Bryobacteraceae bacterium]|nr:tetratricopeptide repeat protein [Bryobacteraceae bacterium]